MSKSTIGFFCGLVIGTPFGALALALCLVGKRAGECIDQMFSDIVPPDRPKNTLPPRLTRN